MRRVFRVVTLFFLAVSSPLLSAQEETAVTLLTNVNVFDGVREKLIENANVVVTGNLITAVSTEPLAVAGGRVIDGAGRTMIPGMIDAHWHTTYCCTPQSTVLSPSAQETH